MVAQADESGTLYQLCKHLRASDLADARMVTIEHPGPSRALGGPASDIHRVYDRGQELRYLLDAADVLHMVDLALESVPMAERVAARLRPPRILLHLTHACFVGQRAQLAAYAAASGAPCIATIPGVEGATFVPPFIPPRTPPWSPLLPGSRARTRSSDLQLVASSASPIRTRPRLERLIEFTEQQLERPRRRSARLDVMTGRPYRETLQRRRRAHVALADADGEMPIEALESWLQGLFVVGEVDDRVRSAYERLAQRDLPLVPPDRLPELLDSLDPENEPDAEAITWARRACDPYRWIEACTLGYAAAPAVSRVA